MTATGSKYEIPEAVDENFLATLGKDVEMQTFKTNLAPESESSTKQDKAVVLQCVGTLTGKENLFVNEHFCRTPPKGSRLPTVCMDIHLKKIKWSSENKEQSSAAIYEIDPEVYKGFNFDSCHGSIVFWTPEYPASLGEVKKWVKSINKLANSRVPFVLITFNSNNLDWIGRGKMFDSVTTLQRFCREMGFISWYEMKARDWDGQVFEQAITCLMDEINLVESA